MSVLTVRVQLTCGQGVCYAEQVCSVFFRPVTALHATTTSTLTALACNVMHCYHSPIIQEDPALLSFIYNENIIGNNLQYKPHHTKLLVLIITSLPSLYCTPQC